MSRKFVNSVRGVREEAGVVKLEFGEESMLPNGTVEFESVVKLCCSTADFEGMVRFLTTKCSEALPKESSSHGDVIADAQTSAPQSDEDKVLSKRYKI